ISILIFGGIAAGLPNAIGGLLELVRTGAMSIIVALFIVVLVALVTYFVVFVERGQRKILVNYARRQVGNKVYGGQSSHLPLKLNMAGVIPPIFASSITLMPAIAVSRISSGDSMLWLKDFSPALAPGQPEYVMLYAAAIAFFCSFNIGAVVEKEPSKSTLWGGATLCFVSVMTRPETSLPFMVAQKLNGSTSRSKIRARSSTGGSMPGQAPPGLIFKYGIRRIILWFRKPKSPRPAPDTSMTS
ncbi:MAG: hypothetical protein WCL00_03630, partial [Bacteroidota bacterium]